MAKKQQHSEVAPKETEPGKQKDDNIDDLGRRTDGSEFDQPVDPDEPDSDGKARSDPDKLSR